MANLSPFQTGYGSLQIFSIHQDVPRDLQSEYILTGLRQDSVTANAPGFFCEAPQYDKMTTLDARKQSNAFVDAQTTIPVQTPMLTFNIIDQGELNEKARPASYESPIITVCPEVVHLSRFANNYVLYPCKDFPTRVDMCYENAEVAEQLGAKSLAHVWKLVASMLSSARVDVLPDKVSVSNNAMQFVLIPSIKSLLEERAEAGDVQTCVALCEVLQVLTTNETTRICGLDISTVRE